MAALLPQLGGVPRTLVWDNESAIGQWKSGRPQLTQVASVFRGMLGAGIPDTSVSRVVVRKT